MRPQPRCGPATPVVRRAARAADKGAQGAAAGAGIPAVARAGARGAPGLLRLVLGPCSALAHLGAAPQLPSARRRDGRGPMTAGAGRTQRRMGSEGRSKGCPGAEKAYREDTEEDAEEDEDGGCGARGTQVNAAALAPPTVGLTSARHGAGPPCPLAG